MTLYLPVGTARLDPPPALVHALGWFARDVLDLEQLFGAVTVKRRRNAARPVQRRRSAFRDRKICMDFLAMAWLGATRLSHIRPYLAPRADVARAFGLRRFCDHTTAHNFLNAFHRTHVDQLDRVNEQLLRAHGAGLTNEAPILDLDVAQRRVHRSGRRRDMVYRWGLGFAAGEAIVQRLHHRRVEWPALGRELFHAARQRLDHKPALARIAGTCASVRLFRAVDRARVPFLSLVSWPWALAHRPARPTAGAWQALEDGRALDLAAPGTRGAASHPFRTILVERTAPVPGMRRQRVALITSILDTPPAALMHLAASQTRIRPFFGHPRWPLGDGKMPSSDPRGNAAYLHLATLATNVLRLFARHLGGGWTLDRLREELRLVPRHARPGQGAARAHSPAERAPRADSP